MDEAKPFKIPKREVWEAFKRVKVNQGAAGVDGQSIAEFEANLSGNLYKLWNRLSSGSYFPPPSAAGSIFQRRMVGRDRWAFRQLLTAIAQEVARRYLEPGDRGAGVSCQLLRLPTRQICPSSKAHNCEHVRLERPEPSWPSLSTAARCPLPSHCVSINPPSTVGFRSLKDSLVVRSSVAILQDIGLPRWASTFARVHRG